jgi:competence protein ComEA
MGLAVLAFFLAFGSAGGGAVLVDGTTELNDPGASAAPAGVAVTQEPEMIVEIVGAVARPGVFHLPGGARVGDLVEAAGGYSARVDAVRATRELNLAARLNDGDQVRVPSRDDEQPSGPVAGGASGAGQGTANGLVDLNRATAAELEALPGIGPVTANKILSARDEAPFSSVDELRTRKLVGEKTFEKLKDLVTVR